MARDNKPLMEAIGNSVKELQQGIDMHCRFLAALLSDNMGENNLPLQPELCPLRLRAARLKEAIKEAIDELEESRKAFKSKRLERLRKKLTKVLIDAD